MHDLQETHMQHDADTSPDWTQNQRARVGDDIQSFAILLDTSQEGFESLGDLPANAFVLVYFVRVLDFLQ